MTVYNRYLSQMSEPALQAACRAIIRSVGSPRGSRGRGREQGERGGLPGHHQVGGEPRGGGGGGWGSRGRAGNRGKTGGVIGFGIGILRHVLRRFFVRGCCLVGNGVCSV